MNETFLEVASWLFPVVLTAILVAPVEVYVRSGWAVRRKEVLGTFTPHSIKRYFKMFMPEFEVTEIADHETKMVFEREYDKRFGRRRFVIPSLLLLLTATPLLYMSVVTGVALLTSDETARRLPPIGVVAVAGAYMWAVNDLVARSRAGDMWPHNLLLTALRFAIAIPVGFAFSASAKEPLALPLAFMVGAFPTRTLINMSRRIATRQLSLGEDAQSSRSELEALQGITAKAAERLVEENVSTIPQLAYTDPIDLTMRTGYSFTFVVDCVSQALAWLYLEDRLPNLRVYGMRGAQEIGNLIDELDEANEDDTIDRAAFIKAVAREQKLNASGFEQMLREIHGDPYTQFLQKIWQPGCGSPTEDNG